MWSGLHRIVAKTAYESDLTMTAFDSWFVVEFPKVKKKMIGNLGSDKLLGNIWYLGLENSLQILRYEKL